MIQSPHGEILKRIRKAIPSDMGEIFLEQEIPGDPEKNHPDIVVINRSSDKVIVVDVSIPFEGEENSLLTAKSTKETKYSALKTCCSHSIRRWSWPHLLLGCWVSGTLIISLSSGC